MREGQNITRARKLRREASRPERQAWAVLRRFRQLGYPVRRQHPVAGLTVDFAITSVRLVIEVDGPLHETPEARCTDAARDAGLAREGWRVLRVGWELAGDADALHARVVDALGLD